jgi:hypothetical protein
LNKERIAAVVKKLKTVNLHNEEARLKVAKMYNFDKQWEVKERELSGKNILKIQHEFTKMRWKEGYDFVHTTEDGDVKLNVYFDLKEGQHRSISLIGVNEGSSYHSYKPKVEYDTLTAEWVKTSLIERNINESDQWKKSISKSTFDAKQLAINEVLRGEYGMRNAIDSEHCQMTLAVEFLVHKPSVNQNTFLKLLREASYQSFQAKTNVSNKDFFEGVIAIFEDIDESVVSQENNRRSSMVNTNLMALGNADSGTAYRRGITSTLPRISKLKKLENDETHSRAEYLKIAPDGILAHPTLKTYISNPSEKNFLETKQILTCLAQTEDDITNVIETGNAKKDNYNPKRIKKYDYQITKDERHQKNADCTSRIRLIPPFSLTTEVVLFNKIDNKYDNIIEKMTKDNGQELLNPYEINLLLVLPIIYKCCHEDCKFYAHLTAEHHQNILHYLMKYHTKFIQVGNPVEIKWPAWNEYKMDRKCSLATEEQCGMASALFLMQAVNACLINEINLSPLTKALARAKYNQKAQENPLTDDKVRYTLGKNTKNTGIRYFFHE